MAVARRIRLLGAGDAVGAGFASALDPRVGADPLSGLFLGTLGVVAAPGSALAAGYLGDGLRGRTVGVLTAAFLLALALVLCARDPLTFLAGWESITLLSATAILVWRRADEGLGAPLRLPGGDASRRRRHVGRDPAARRMPVRSRLRRARHRLGHADRRRRGRARGMGTKAG